ncbi:hypothetical protein Pint_20030 [Pistacia integerrima]|uniref:Uncharacterized protein n=1 Tax=Pistacia integerrima TaxID=434235 RepID=A0ACC0X863_9ROSI|nr:hypothetical protein Pint_20030 [Pistacia integerrima]
MVEFAASIAGIVGTVLGVGKCFTYLFNHKSNLSKLEREVGKLKVTKNIVDGKVEDARNNVEEILETVEQWVIRVNSIVPEADTLIEERANVGCFNLKARYRQSRRASIKVEEVAQLLEEREAFGNKEDEAWNLFRKMTELPRSLKKVLFI